MRNVVIMLLFLGLGEVHAAEVSLIGKGASAAPSQASGGSDMFDQMRDFIRQQDERLKDIKLLNLDLERVNLLLKKREAEAKLVRLDKRHDTLLPAAGPSKPAVRLAGVVLAGGAPEALMNVEGAYVAVREGAALRQGYVVKRIRPEGVTLRAPDGGETVLTLDS